MNVCNRPAYSHLTLSSPYMGFRPSATLISIKWLPKVKEWMRFFFVLHYLLLSLIPCYSTICVALIALRRLLLNQYRFGHDDNPPPCLRIRVSGFVFARLPKPAHIHILRCLEGLFFITGKKTELLSIRYIVPSQAMDNEIHTVLFSLYKANK